MNQCSWENDDPPKVFRCKRCGFERDRSAIPLLPYRRSCAVQRPAGFGDWLARLFGWIGFKQRKGCGCAKRQATLNRWIPFDLRVWRARLLWLTFPFRRITLSLRRADDESKPQTD